jgi:hypothetical protein
MTVFIFCLGSIGVAPFTQQLNKRFAAGRERPLLLPRDVGFSFEA